VIQNEDEKTDAQENAGNGHELVIRAESISKYPYERIIRLNILSTINEWYSYVVIHHD
jgi:hypothetical protein